MKWFDKININEIVLWCNYNQGFVSAVLTVMTLFISVLALVISIKLGMIPYKKKLRAIPAYYEKKGIPTIDLLLVNHGFTPIVINYISIMDKNKRNVGSTMMIEPIVIKPSCYTTVTISLNDWDGLIKKHSINLNYNMIIEVHEYGGKTYKYKKGFPVG